MEIFEEKICSPFSAFLNIASSDVKPHWHNYIEMLYLIAGDSIVNVDGISYPMQKDDFLIINSREVHSTQNMHNTRYFVLQFNPEIFYPGMMVFSESVYLLPFLQRRLKYEKLIHVKDEDMLKQLFDEILGDFNEGCKGYELNIKGNIYKIFAWLIKNEYIVLPDLESVSPLEISRLSSLLEYIRNNYKEKITDKTASSMSCMSYYHFCRIFKKVTGRTFIQYLNYIRLIEAEKMLTLTNKTITEIALDSGFSSTSYFTRIFKREKGTSPLIYRNQNCAKKEQF